MEKYKKYEFCKDIDCYYYEPSECTTLHPFMCPYSAKQFHKWLKEQGYIIVKAPRLEFTSIENQLPGTKHPA